VAERLDALGVGVEVGGRLISSLLYADDVVLMADSPEDLQRMIDVVDTFCNQWRMDINLTKSQAMVVGKKDKCDLCKKASNKKERPAGPCSEKCGHRWTCRGKVVPVVGKYKYLGIWFTENLTWDAHIAKMLEKASKRTSSLYSFLSKNRVPVRAKMLVWTAYVRPLLEYGGEVWEANETQWRLIEAQQSKAGIVAMKLNKKTNQTAVRALMQVPSIRTRQKCARLKYVAKMMTMDDDRITRHVAWDLKGPRSAKRKGRTNKPWNRTTLDLIKSEPDLYAGYKRMKQARERNGNILPIGADPTWPGEDNMYEYEPVLAWRSCVDRWAHAVRKAAVKTGSNLSLIKRSYRGNRRVPKFQLTRLPNWGANQIRVRLLAGTSALHCTLSKYRDRPKTCPMGCDEVEDPVHFLVKCEASADARERYVNDLSVYCSREHEVGEDGRGATNCKEYYESLDDKGKAVFMLGGPLHLSHPKKGARPWIPEPAVDRLARCFVRLAWTNRSESLDKSNDNVVDLTTRVSNRKASRSVTEYFIPVAAGTYETNERGERHNTNTHMHTHAHERSPRLVQPRSGSHGPPAKEYE